MMSKLESNFQCHQIDCLEHFRVIKFEWKSRNKRNDYFYVTMMISISFLSHNPVVAVNFPSNKFFDCPIFFMINKC